MKLIFVSVQNKYNNVVSMLSNSSIIFLLVLIYKFIFDIIYLHCLVEEFGVLLDISFINVISSYLMVALFAFALNLFYEEETASNLFLIILTLVYFIPLTTLCAFGGGNSGFLFGSIVFYIIIITLQYVVPLYEIQCKCLPENRKVIFMQGFILVSIAIGTYILIKYGGDKVALNLFDVYGIRENAESNGMGTAMGYLFSIIKITVPVTILYCLQYRKYIWGIVLVIMELMLYSIDAVKSVLFLLILAIIGYYAYKRNMHRLFLPMAIILEVAALLEKALNNSLYIMDLFIRRVMYTPVALGERYFDFFINNPLDVGRSSILGKIGFTSPYKQGLVTVIGNNYNNQSIHANTGLLGDSFPTLGVLGFIVFPIILFVCIRLLDVMSDSIDMKCIIGCVIYYVIAFTNAVWSTVLLSHGFIVVCILYYMFPKKNYANERRITPSDT